MTILELHHDVSIVKSRVEHEMPRVLKLLRATAQEHEKEVDRSRSSILESIDMLFSLPAPDERVEHCKASISHLKGMLGELRNDTCKMGDHVSDLLGHVRSLSGVVGAAAAEMKDHQP